MTPRERFVNCLMGRMVDHIPFTSPFWGPWAKTEKMWLRQGMRKQKDWYELFGFEPLEFIPINSFVWPYFDAETLIDEGDTFVHRNEYGVVVRDRKELDSMSQFLEHPVKDRKTWEQFKKERLDPNSPGRFPENWSMLVKKYADRDFPIILGGYPCGFFGSIRWLMGDVDFLMAAAAEPEFVLEINQHFCHLWYTLIERVLEKVKPDAYWFWEDLAGRQGSMISPMMFRKYMTPFYEHIISLVKSHGVEIIIVDSDGFIDDLAPLFADAGVNCIFPWEVQADNDLRKVRSKCPNMAFMGAMDKRAIAAGKDQIDTEIDRIRELLSVGRFIPFPDHLIPPDVSWDNYCYFVQKWRDMLLEKSYYEHA